MASRAVRGKTKKKNLVTLYMGIPTKTYAKLVSLADKQGKTISRVAREIIEKSA